MYVTIQFRNVICVASFQRLKKEMNNAVAGNVIFHSLPSYDPSFPNTLLTPLQIDVTNVKEKEKGSYKSFVALSSLSLWNKDNNIYL